MNHLFPLRGVLAVQALLLLGACATAPPFSYRAPAATEAYLQPEGSSGYSDKPGWATRNFAVAAGELGVMWTTRAPSCRDNPRR